MTYRGAPTFQASCWCGHLSSLLILTGLERGVWAEVPVPAVEGRCVPRLEAKALQCARCGAHSPPALSPGTDS